MNENTFDCFDITDYTKGAVDRIQNLRPICNPCGNTLIKRGYVDMYNFITRYGFQQVMIKNTVMTKLTIKQFYNLLRDFGYERLFAEYENTAGNYFKFRYQFFMIGINYQLGLDDKMEIEFDMKDIALYNKKDICPDLYVDLAGLHQAFVSTQKYQ